MRSTSARAVRVSWRVVDGKVSQFIATRLESSASLAHSKRASRAPRPRLCLSVLAWSCRALLSARIMTRRSVCPPRGSRLALIHHSPAAAGAFPTYMHPRLVCADSSR